MTVGGLRIGISFNIAAIKMQGKISCKAPRTLELGAIEIIIIILLLLMIVES